MFQNSAATQFNKKMTTNFSMSLTDEHDIFDKHQAQFSLLDTEQIFKATYSDLDQLLTIIEETEDYLSLEQIIE